jgi:hypothetical protein
MPLRGLYATALITEKDVIPVKAEILLRVIILQLVRFHSVNRDEVITIRATLHDGALPLPAAGRRKQ